MSAPAAVWENVPAFFLDRPATVEAVWSALVSGFYGSSILIVAAAQGGAFDTFTHTVQWVQGHWWSLLTAAAIAMLRGQQAAAKTTAATKGI